MVDKLASRFSELSGEFGTAGVGFFRDLDHGGSDGETGPRTKTLTTHVEVHYEVVAGQRPVAVGSGFRQ